ncbi:MAG: HNH endonuclease, partial [Paludibacteraceae bacterium]|nr:HNH endonuclease [Paludibacteraceae bacterium]
DQDILELNFNRDEINDYINEQQIEKYKEELKADELKKALKQIARQRLVEEGVIFDEEHKRPYIPRDIVGLVYMRDGGRCRECGSTKNLQLDHIIPFSKGGSSELENLQLLCKECNLKKGAKI